MGGDNLELQANFLRTDTQQESLTSETWKL